MIKDHFVYPYQIRLGAPWERVHAPDGTVLFRRRFGRPRQIDDWERVWLLPATDCPTVPGVWRLNGVELVWSQRGDDRPRSEITAALRERNELVVERIPEATAREFAGAVLEIGCRADIDRVQTDTLRVEGGAVLHVTIDVVSESPDDPLELYALLGGETFGYYGPFFAIGTIRHEFNVTERLLRPGEMVALRVELICRSTVWDTCEVTVVFPGK